MFCVLRRLMLQFYTQNGEIIDEMKRIRLSFLADHSLEIFALILEIVCIHYADKFETFLDCLGYLFYLLIFELLKKFIFLFNILDMNSNSSEEDFNEKLYKQIREFTV